MTTIAKLFSFLAQRLQIFNRQLKSFNSIEWIQNHLFLYIIRRNSKCPFEVALKENCCKHTMSNLTQLFENRVENYIWARRGKEKKGEGTIELIIFPRSYQTRMQSRHVRFQSDRGRAARARAAQKAGQTCQIIVSGNLAKNGAEEGRKTSCSGRNEAGLGRDPEESWRPGSRSPFNIDSFRTGLRANSAYSAESRTQ